MKSLSNKALIYDNTCPVCEMYSDKFVKHGLLKKENRLAFTELNNQEFICRMDPQRSRNEIPLVDLESGETIYGLDALVFILSQRWPFIDGFVHKRPFYWFFKRLYAMISFNRRVIVTSGKPKAAFDCTPDLNLKYRSAYVVFAIIVSSLITAWFGHSMGNYLSISDGGSKMLLIAGTGWCVQILLAFLFMKEKRADYIGHLATLMIIGVLLLVPGIILGAVTQYHYPVIPVISVLASSGMMLWQHAKRVKNLQLNQLWTFAWLCSLQLTALFWVTRFYQF